MASRWNNLAKIDLDLALRLYSENHSLKYISKQFGTTDTRLARVFKMNGIKIKSKSDLTNDNYPINSDVINSIIDDYVVNKITNRILCKKYGITLYWLQKIIKNFNVPKNTRSEKMEATWAMGIRKARNCNKGGSKDIHNAIYNRWKNNAKSRNYPFDLSIDYLQNLLEKQNFKCGYTKMNMLCPKTYNERKEMTSNPYLISLDRIDNKLGYIEGNVHFVCVWVNKAKGAYSHETFKGILNDFRNV